MIVSYGEREVDGGEDHEDVGLDDGDAEVEAEEHERDADGDEREKGEGDHVAGEHVGVETDGEREHAGEVGDDLDGEHQGVEPPDGAEELLDVAEAVHADAVVVVVEEGDEREAEGDDGVGGGRLEAGDEAHEVAEQDEEDEHGEVGGEALVAVADDAFALLADELAGELGEVLDGAGLLDREADADGDEVKQEQDEEDELHAEGVGDGRVREGGGDVQGAEEGVRLGGEVVVQQAGEEELGGHKVLGGTAVIQSSAS